jgi:hypothetical protein
MRTVGRASVNRGDGVLESLRRHYRMDRRQIHFLRFLLEAYEGVGVLTTLDQTAGLVVLLVAPGREAEASQLVEQLRKEIMIEPVPSA